MIDRRRLARLIALACAGLAVAGTSATPPSPGPTQRVQVGGTLHLTTDAPVAVQPIAVEGRTAGLESLTVTVRLSRLPDDGSVIATLEALDGSSARPEDPAAPIAAEPGVIAAVFPFSCGSEACRPMYGVVLTWAGAPPGGDVEVAWSLDAIARFGYGSTPSAGTESFALRLLDSIRPEAVEVSSATGGVLVHLTEADRFRAWTVELYRDAPADAQPKDRPITQAVLSAVVTQAAGPAFGGDAGRERGRRDPPVQLRVVGVNGAQAPRWAADPPLTFDPFSGCSLNGPCDVALTVVLAWADGRPETAFDAAWHLDLTAIGRTTPVGPVTAKVTRIDAVGMSTRTSSGSFETVGRINRGETPWTVVARPSVDGASPWMSLGLPARGIVTATVTSIGETAAPDGTIILLEAGSRYAALGGLPGYAEARLGEEIRFAFEPSIGCATGRPDGCQAEGTIGATVSAPNPNAAGPGLKFRVDWVLEIGLAVTDDDGFVIGGPAAPSATARP